MAINNLQNYKDTDGFGMSLNIRRGNPNPLDNSSVWQSLAEAQEYATSNPIAYVGQPLSVINEDTVDYYIITNEQGDLKKVGSDTENTSSTTYHIINQFSETEINALLNQGYSEFIIDVPLTVTYNNINENKNNQLVYITFNMSFAQSNILIKTAPGIRLNAILQIKASGKNNYIPTVEGMYSGIEIIKDGLIEGTRTLSDESVVILSNVNSIGQVGSRQRSGRFCENVRGISGIAVYGATEVIGDTIEYRPGPIKLIIQGQVYTEGAFNAEGLGIFANPTIITGDNLTAIGNHGFEYYNNDLENITGKQIPQDYYITSSAYNGSEYYPCWTSETWNTSQIKNTSGSGIGLSNHACINVVKNETGTWSVGYGSYTKYDSISDRYEEKEDNYSFGCGYITINNLNYLRAEGWGPNGAGIGGGFKQRYEQGGTSLELRNIGLVLVKGGYATNKFLDRNKKIYEIGWTDAPIGGPAIGASLLNKIIYDNSIFIDNTTILQCYGGGSSAAIGNTWGGISSITIEHSTINQCYGGAGAAAIGCGRIKKDNDTSIMANEGANVEIQDSKINAYGGEYGTIIGTGYMSDRSAVPKPRFEINLTNCKISGCAGRLAAGIGSGYLAGAAEDNQGRSVEIVDCQLNLESNDNTEPMVWPSGWGDWGAANISAATLQSQPGWSFGGVYNTNLYNEIQTSNYVMPWTKAQLVGYGVQDVMEGATQMLDGYCSELYGNTLYFKEINPNITIAFSSKDAWGNSMQEKVEFPLADIPWIYTEYLSEYEKIIVLWHYTDSDVNWAITYGNYTDTSNSINLQNYISDLIIDEYEPKVHHITYNLMGAVIDVRAINDNGINNAQPLQCAAIMIDKAQGRTDLVRKLYCKKFTIPVI